MTVVKLPVKKPGLIPVHDAVKEANDHAVALASQRHYRAAVVAAKRAISVLPNSKELWSNLATFYWNLHEFDEAMACVERSLAIDADYGKAHFNKALVLESMHRFTEADAEFDRAMPIDSDFINVQRCQAMLRLALGDYANGFKGYEARIPWGRETGKYTSYPKFPAPYWEGQDIKGKRLFVCVEQGIGDTILFSRWLPWLKEQIGEHGKIYLCCRQDMMVLLWEFRHLLEFVPEATPIPEADYSLYTGSLPWFARTTMETIPADPGLIRKRADVQMRIGPAQVAKPNGPDPSKVGIVWTGNPAFDRNEERSIPLELMLGMAAHPNIWLYSLQGGTGKQQIEALGADNLICELGSTLEKQGLAVAATAILQMDLMITSCTSMAHLAGALGVETWLVVCTTPYWLWMHERSDTPWYPSIRIYRQDKPNDWASVMANVQDELFEKIDRRKRDKLHTA